MNPQTPADNTHLTVHDHAGLSLRPRFEQDHTYFTTHRFKLSDEFVEQYKDKRPPWGPFGEVTYLRTYSRWLPEENRREYWHETVRRVVEYSFSLVVTHNTDYWSEPLYSDLVQEAEDLFDLIFNLKAFPAGRTLWVGGTDFSYTHRGAPTNFNCAFQDIKTLDDWRQMVVLLMGGSGVGFRVTQDNVEKMNQEHPFGQHPQVQVQPYRHLTSEPHFEHTTCTFDDKKKSVEITVGDSREGWSVFVKHFLHHFVTNPLQLKKIVVNVNYVRPLGSRLSTFGGFASGPEPLIQFAQDAQTILDDKNPNWTDLKMLDISNIIGRMVVAGGTRRSAQIALGDTEQFADAKTGAWWKSTPWRSQSNNTVVFKDKPTQEELKKRFRQILQYGEPGFLNEKEAQRRRPRFRGINPCAEILLADSGFCNLCTVNLAAFVVRNPHTGDCEFDWHGAQRAFVLVARHGMRVTNVDMGGVLPEWNHNQQGDRLLGVSFTGYGDMVDSTGMLEEEQAKFLSDTRQLIRRYIEGYAAEMGVPKPLLITTVKPEGTISTLPGVSSGLHYAFAPKYIRRVRVAKADTLAKALMYAGFEPKPEYDVSFYRYNDTTYTSFQAALDDVLASGVQPSEAGQHIETVLKTLDEVQTWVFEFLVDSPAPKKSSEYTAIEQLERYRLVQQNWSEHNSSNTIYISKEEVPGIIEWLDQHWDSYVAVSFLQKDEQQYHLMPYEAITHDDPRIKDLAIGDVASVREMLDMLEVADSSVELLESCDTGACPTR